MGGGIGYLERLCVMEDLAAASVVEFCIPEYLCDIPNKLRKLGVPALLQRRLPPRQPPQCSCTWTNLYVV